MQGNDSTKYNIYVNMYIYVYYIYIYIYIYINKGYRLIFSLVLVDGMFVLEGILFWFDLLVQKFPRYNYYQKSYEQSLTERILSTGLNLTKRRAFQPVLPEFNLNWKNVLYDAGKKLVKLLLDKSTKLITKWGIATEIETNYPEKTRVEREKIKLK